ncbi:MAG: hypothetical protein RIC55_14195 [Pirellulaceae bacterium]
MKTAAPLAAVALLFAAFHGTTNAGWFEDATGVSTPEPIRKIAPNGIRFPRGGQSTSRFGTMSHSYFIADDGSIYSRTHYDGGSSSNWSKTSDRAALKYNSQGHAYWVFRSADNSPRRVQRYDKPRVRQVGGNYQSNYGNVYISQQGNRISGNIRYRNGHTGTFNGTINGNRLTLNWQNGPDYGVASLNIDTRGNIAGPFHSNYNSGRGYWQLYR